MSGAGAAVQRHMDEEDGPLVTDLWRRTLRRRSQKDRLTWDQMTKLVDDWLPKPSYQPSTNPPGSPLVRQLHTMVLTTRALLKVVIQILAYRHIDDPKLCLCVAEHTIDQPERILVALKKVCALLQQRGSYWLI